MNSKPLVLVDDDFDDQEMITLALRDLGFKNEIMTFKDADGALQFLRSGVGTPFLIVSDINMPKMDGLGFKQEIETCSILSKKSIPFVFLSTASSSSYINKAYELKAQGFFEKGHSFEHLKVSLKTILDYWSRSKHPN